MGASEWNISGRRDVAATRLCATVEENDENDENTMKREREPGPIELFHEDFRIGVKQVASATVDLAICEPPYNISVKGGEKWDKLPMYLDWAKTWLPEIVRCLRPGGALLLFGSPVRSWIPRLIVLLEDELHMKFVSDLPWVYTQGGDSRLQSMTMYAVRHERLVWLEKPGTRTFNASEATEHSTDEDKAVALAKGGGRVTGDALDRGRPPRTFIDVPRENSRSKERAYGKHPSMKPLALCERLVKVHSNPGDLVLVPFAGSGSELVAAAELGRRSVGFELEPAYVDLCEKRFRGHGLGFRRLKPPPPPSTPSPPSPARPAARPATLATTPAEADPESSADEECPRRP